MRVGKWFWVALCFLLFHNAAFGAQSFNSSGYHLVEIIALGGEGRWDYLTLDNQTHRLYISRSSHVLVVNTDSGKVIGDIPDTDGVHGIALVPELNKGFTSNGHEATVTVFDLQTLKPLIKIPVGKNPDAIIYDPASGHVFTFNGASHDITAIDPKSGMVVGTVVLDGRPEYAVADNQGHIYVNLEDKSQVVELDSRKLAIKARWPLAPGEGPTGISMDQAHRRLFIGCTNKLMVVMNADNGKVTATLPIGSGVDATAFDPETGLAFSSNGEGTLTVIHEDSPDKFSVLENVVTQKGARTMALDLKAHRIYLATAELGDTPTPTTELPHPRSSIVPGSFVILVMGKLIANAGLPLKD
ncbi:MAG: YncE family protein [Thermodesulfobacteriota bacterium]